MRVAALLLAVIAQPVCAKWQRLESPGFEMYTDAGMRRGTQVLQRLERIRAVFRVTAQAKRSNPLPVRVYLFGSQEQYHAYRPSATTAAFYQSAPARDSIVMAVYDELDRAARHEYVHAALNHSSGPLPKWVEEGLAEFYSTIDIGRQNAVVGGSLPKHLAVLDSQRWLTADELASIDKKSPYYNESDKVGLFYAQSWALAHMLSLGDGYGEGMPRFLELLDGGAPQQEAFAEAFGKGLAAAIEDLRNYMPMVRLRTARLHLDEPLTAPEINARDLPADEADIALAELAIDTGNHDLADRIYRRLAAGDADSPDVQSGLGVLALSGKRYDEAARHFKRAISLGSRKADTHFEYAMLMRDSGAEPAKVREQLLRAVELNPRHAEAHFLLGVMASNAKRYEDAVAHIEKAAAVFPRQCYFWHALGMAYVQLHRADDAREAARRALAAAATEQETEMALALARLTSGEQTAAAPRRAGVTTPESWKGAQGDARVEGALAQIDCLGASARVHVKAAGTAIALYIQHPGEVTLRNLTSATFEFRCGAQDGRAVAVEYRARPDAATATAGVVTAIEFR